MRMNLVALTVSPVFLIAALGAPQGAQRTLVPDSRQHSRVVTFQISADTLIDKPSGIAFDSAGYAYVGNQGGPAGYSVTVYPARANGNVSPARTIAGSLTGLNYPGGVAVDGSGYAYVVNQVPASAPSLTVYAPGANGNVAPMRSISGSLTGLGAPYGIAVDGAGYVYVVNTGFAGFTSITVYSPGASGNVAPVRTITGSATGLHEPYGIAVDSAGYAYVANSQDVGGNASVTVYAPGANGNAAPVRTIAGAATGLAYSLAIAVSASGYTYVANVPSNGSYSITVYSPGANGNVQPVRTIVGPHTLLSYPTGLAVDAKNEAYVTQFFTSGVTAYAPRASGDAVPRRVLATVGSVPIPQLNGLSGTYSYWYVYGSTQLSVQSWWQSYGNPPQPTNGGTIVAYLLMQGSLPTPSPFSQTDKNSVISYGLLDPAKTYSIAVFGTGCTAWYTGTLRCSKSCSSKPSRCGCCRTAVVEFSLADVGSPTNGTLAFPSPLNATLNGTAPIFIELVENPSFFQRRLRPFRDWNTVSTVPAGTLEWLAAVSAGRCPHGASSAAHLASAAAN